MGRANYDPADALSPRASIIALALFAAGGWTAFLVTGGWQTTRELLRPPYVQCAGKIIESSTRASKRWMGYFPVVTYAFDVDGREYRGSSLEKYSVNAKVRRRWLSQTKDGTLAGLSVGTPIQIMYDPSDPSLSYAVIPGKEGMTGTGAGAMLAQYGSLAVCNGVSAALLITMAVKRRRARVAGGL